MYVTDKVDHLKVISVIILVIIRYCELKNDEVNRDGWQRAASKETANGHILKC